MNFRQIVEFYTVPALILAWILFFVLHAMGTFWSSLALPVLLLIAGAVLVLNFIFSLRKR